MPAVLPACWFVFNIASQMDVTIQTILLAITACLVSLDYQLATYFHEMVNNWLEQI